MTTRPEFGCYTYGTPPLSATEREQQRVAYIAAVDVMATALRNQTARIQHYESYEESVRRHENRIDAMERQFALFRAASFMARLRWLVLGCR